MDLYSKVSIFSTIHRGTRYLSTGAAILAKSHYDSLGITPSATQKDVKEAYYNLSKLYHPDRNEGSKEASTKFREVTEAYEVLGNIRLRKLYDRGASNIGKQAQYDSKDDATTSFYRSRDERLRRPAPTGRTPIYDFDEWSRSHYESTFARDMYYKEMVKRHRVQQQTDKDDVSSERAMIAMGVTFLCCVLISYSLQNADNTSIARDVHKSTKSSKKD